MKNFKLTVSPAIPIEIRHKIEHLLEIEGYDVWAGGTRMDGSQSDISFREKGKPRPNNRSQDEAKKYK